MDQVGGSGIGGPDGMPPWHQRTHDAVGLDYPLVMLRHNTREKISDYLGRRPMEAKWQSRLPDLVRRLEEILFREYPNKGDYCKMAMGPTEAHFMFALTILSAQYQQCQQNQQLSWQVAPSHGYEMMTQAPGVTQGASENSRMSCVPYNMGPSFGTCLVSQSANMGASLPGGGPDDHVNTELSLGINPTQHDRSRVANNNYVVNTVDASETNKISPKVTLPPPVTVKEKRKFGCPVCLDEMVDASSTLCGHIFCERCIKASIKAQRKCPTCRRKLNMRNFHRVYLPTMD